MANDKPKAPEAALPAPVVRDLIPTGVHTEFGEVMDDPSAPTLGGRTVDVTYVPGHSDRRWERDVALAEARKGLRREADVPVLDGNVRWVRRSAANGAPGQSKEMKSKLKGYEYVRATDVGPGKRITEVPKGATLLPDGTYAMGDTVLMQCDAATAARNAYEKQRKTLDRLAASEEKAAMSGVDTEKRLSEALAGNPQTRFQTR